jgi:DNA-binding NtrC family response regulator
MAPRILVIDDERDVRLGVEALLALTMDCHVEGAATFADGRSRAHEPWDMVISDFALPDGNGAELLDAFEPRMPRVLMSAFEEHPGVEAALRTRALSAFVAKPFEPESFVQRMRRLLAHSHRPGGSFGRFDS